MKTRQKVFRLLTGGSLLAFAFVLAGCASPEGKPTTRVYEEREFIPLYHVQNTGDEMNQKKEDKIAMACVKCNTVFKGNVHRPVRKVGVPVERLHYCPGCKSTITVTGWGFNSKEEVKHTCDGCGDTSAFCCATRRDAPPTEGMTPQK